MTWVVSLFSTGLNFEPLAFLAFLIVIINVNSGDCVKILRQCKAAVTKNGRKGKVIIIDMVIENQNEDEKSIETQLFFDKLMMVLVTGRKRNEKEWAKLFLNAGFRDYKITPILGLRSLIEVYPY